MNKNITHHGTTHVGLDVHQKTIAVAVLLPGRDNPVQWQIDNTPKARRTLARKLKLLWPGEMVCVYEAGPTGFSTQRQLAKLGLACRVAAPSRIPIIPGLQRKKSDKRDAFKLARLLRGEQLDFVVPPTPEEEAVRDLCRAYRLAVKDQTRHRNRVGKLLLKLGVVYVDGKNWTQRHLHWLRGLKLEDALHQTVLGDQLLALEQLAGRIAALVESIAGQAREDRYREKAGWLRCYAGIDTATAMLILTELHGIERFGTATQLMSYCGLTPSEHSSGQKERRFGIDKAGNAHLRWALIETAWHYRHPVRVSRSLRLRRQGQPAWVIARADKARQRGRLRFTKFMAKDKPSAKAVVAVARELAGFLWDTLQGPAAQRASPAAPPKPQAQHRQKTAKQHAA